MPFRICSLVRAFRVSFMSTIKFIETSILFVKNDDLDCVNKTNKTNRMCIAVICVHEGLAKINEYKRNDSVRSVQFWPIVLVAPLR